MWMLGLKVIIPSNNMAMKKLRQAEMAPINTMTGQKYKSNKEKHKDNSKILTRTWLPPQYTR